MLNISGIQEGFVLDHIRAGMSMSIMAYKIRPAGLPGSHYQKCQKQQNGKKRHDQGRVPDRYAES